MGVFEQQSPEAQKAIKGNIEEIVTQLILKSGADELIKEICEQAKDKYEIKPGDLKARAVQLYKKRYEEEKYKEAREKVEAMYDDIDFLEK